MSVFPNPWPVMSEPRPFLVDAAPGKPKASTIELPPEWLPGPFAG